MQEGGNIIESHTRHAKKYLAVIALALISYVLSMAGDSSGEAIISDPWLNGFGYRNAITINNGGGELTDYQVLIMLPNTNTLITAGKMQSGCQDIRVTDSDGISQLNYWIDSSCNTASTRIWTKVPLIPAGGKTIYVYYGNSLATSAKNGNNVFEFFDDFEGASIDSAKWSISGSGITQTGGYLYASSNNEQWKRIRSTQSFGSNNILEYSISYADSADVGGQATGYHGFYDTSAGEPPGTTCCNWGTALTEIVKHMGFGEGWCADWQMCAEQANGANREGETVGVNLNTVWNYMQLKWYGSSSYLHAEYPGFSYSKTLSSYTPSGTTMNIFFGVNDNRDGAYPITIMKVYWVGVRKYVSPEPTTSPVGEDALTTQVGNSPADWSWKVPANGEKIRASPTSSLTWEQYRKPITLSPITPFENYQVLVTADTATPISQNKMRADCGDIRFTDSNGITLQNYWIESGCNSPSTKIWVKVVNSATSKIYLYYGNSTIASSSNAKTTFAGYWPWNSNADGWTLTGGVSGNGNSWFETESIIADCCNCGPVPWYISWNLPSSTYAMKFQTHSTSDGSGGLRLKIQNSAGVWTTPYDECLYGDASWQWKGEYIYTGDIKEIRFEQYAATCGDGKSCFGEFRWADNLIIRKYSISEPLPSVSGEEGPFTPTNPAENWTWTTFQNDGTGITVPKSISGTSPDLWSWWP